MQVNQGLDRQLALSRLREISSMGFLKCETKGPKAVSLAISNALQAHDANQVVIGGYKILTTRAGVSSRLSMFSKVSDWSLAKLKSSTEILKTFGTEDSGILRLNCTMRYGSPNSHGLALDLSEDSRHIYTVSSTDALNPVEVWDLSEISERILNKLTAFAIVECDAKKILGDEFVKPIKVTFYSEPKEDLVLRLVKSGALTIDHLASAKLGSAAHEKGPIFKLDRSHLLKMYGQSSSHNL